MTNEALIESVAARLTARIAPNAPATDEQREAFDRAVQAQAEFEATHADAVDAAACGVTRFSIGHYAETRTAAGEPLCPYARALLENAGLLRRSLPTARRLP